ncbi:MAG: hypothetical protein KJ061_08525 [Vicinamibacteraceae bacterium]|nr:hypothetical protein [Vicinamibacteraceae bacterium]
MARIPAPDLPKSSSRPKAAAVRSTSRAREAPAAGLELPAPAAPAVRDEIVRASLSRVIPTLPFEAVVARPPVEAGAASRRARPPVGDLATVALVRRDGLLHWTYEPPVARAGVVRPRVPVEAAGAGKPVTTFSFSEIPPNEVIRKLEELDRALTPNQGLRRWHDGRLTKVRTPASTRRALLVIHGTFCGSDAVLDEMQSTPEGRAFLAAAEARYGQVLAFDHPTLSVSPVMNALDLEQALRNYDGEIDVICHSRGGLVAAWWCRTGWRNVDRLVCVGSPLEGTSLAAPSRVKTALDYFANVADAVGTLATVAGGFGPPMAPLLGMAAGLMAIIGTGLWAGAATPLVDAGVAIVPGLAAQSRVANNQELLRLQRDRWPSAPEVYAVRSDFEPDAPDAPWWQFWRRWNRPLALVDPLADRVFTDANDLVVDNETMVRAVKPLATDHVFTYATNGRVHHCNYFAQPETVKQLRDWLRV